MLERPRQLVRLTSGLAQPRTSGPPQSTAPAIQTLPAAGGVTVLGHDAFIVGGLRIAGAVHFSGRLMGEIHCQSIIVTSDAHAEGILVAERIEIAGTVQGEIYSNEVRLRSGCNIEAEMYHRELQLEAGAFFEGKSRRHANPLSLAPDFDSFLK